MNIMKIILITLFAMSCSAVQESGKVRETLDINSEVDLFLSTQDPDVENQVIKRLQSAQVQHETVKSIFRARTKKKTQPRRTTK
jgi:chorismate mutase